MFCASCGKEIEPASQFCAGCGATLASHPDDGRKSLLKKLLVGFVLLFGLSVVFSVASVAPNLWIMFGPRAKYGSKYDPVAQNAKNQVVWDKDGKPRDQDGKPKALPPWMDTSDLLYVQQDKTPFYILYPGPNDKSTIPAIRSYPNYNTPGHGENTRPALEAARGTIVYKPTVERHGWSAVKLRDSSGTYWVLSSALGTTKPAPEPPKFKVPAPRFLPQNKR